jgi:hypothetical protein
MVPDERLTRELERAARPADPSGLYEQLIRRRERRNIARKARTVVLAAAVVAGSIAGGFALSRVFGVSNPVEPAGPSPNPTTSSLPRGAQDIGIGFPVCRVERLGQIDFLDDGTAGSAWTGIRLDEDGTCSRDPDVRHILAADHTGDRLADSWMDLSFECSALCPPFAATDLDGNGTEELIVANLFSIMDFYLFAVRSNESGDFRLEPLLVAHPGHRPAGIEAGEPLRIDAGGDEGYSSSIECRGYPSEPVIVWSWGYVPIDAGGPGEVHRTRIELQSDGMFHVVDSNDLRLPAGSDPEIAYQGDRGDQCGVYWWM